MQFLWNSFYMLLIEFYKILFVFAFQKRFWKNLNFFIFFFASNWYIFMFSDHFDMLISKIIFLK
jgi:hypothetical protein